MADSAWENVQIKGLTAWANSVLPAGNTITSLQTDLIDGVKLCLLVEGLKDRIEELQRKKIGAWQRKPAHRMQKIENANCALRFLSSDIKVKVTAGAEDIVGNQDTQQSNLKMVLGLLWSTFRKTMGIAEGTSTSEEYAGLLNWVRDVTAGYAGVEIKGMKDSWSDGLAFAAMLHKCGVKIPFDTMKSSNGAENLAVAFRMAEETFGVPQLLEIDDVVKCTPDERTVAFYLNLLKHSMQEHFEKNKIKMGAQALQDELSSLKAKLAEESRLRAQLEEELRKLRLLEEELSSKLKLEENLRVEDKTNFEEQLQKLQLMLSEEQEDGRKAEDELRRLKMDLEDALRAKHELEELRRKLEGEGGSLASQLAAETSARQKLEAELEELRRQLAAEQERRKNRSRAAEELEAENARLKQQALMQKQMRAGLDVLKTNLMCHLEDLYQWRDVQTEEDEARGDVFDLKGMVSSLDGKSHEHQIQVLSEQLAGENQNLQRLIHIKDAQAELNDLVDKSGWLQLKGAVKGQKDYTKYWFVMQGTTLSYYKNDHAARPNGTIPLLKSKVHSAKKEEGHEFVISLDIDDRQLLLSCKDRKDRDQWRQALGGAVARLQYCEAIRKKGPSRRPDSRVVHACRTSSLPDIHLDHVPLQLEEINAINAALRAHNPVFGTISFENAGLGDDELKMLAKGLAGVQFQVLRLNGNKNLTGAGLASILEALEKNAKDITELNLSNCSIDDAGVVAVLPVLKANSGKLISLDLSGNKLTASGVSNLVAAVEGCHSLTQLKLANNQISNAGAIASLLKKASHVRSVLLAGNQLGDAGATAIAEACASADGVSELDLSNNGLTSAGVAAVLAAIAKSQSLNRVTLSDNKIASGADLSGLSNGGLNFSSMAFARAAAV